MCHIRRLVLEAGCSPVLHQGLALAGSRVCWALEPTIENDGLWYDRFMYQANWRRIPGKIKIPLISFTLKILLKMAWYNNGAWILLKIEWWCYDFILKPSRNIIGVCILLAEPPQEGNASQSYRIRRSHWDLCYDQRRSRCQKSII